MAFTQFVITKILNTQDFDLLYKKFDTLTSHCLLDNDSINTEVSVFGFLDNNLEIAQELAKHYNTNVITYPPNEDAPYGQWILVEPDGSMYRIQEVYNSEPFDVDMSTKQPFKLPQSVA